MHAFMQSHNKNTFVKWQAITVSMSGGGNGGLSGEMLSHFLK